jgi:hypothetical protein
MMETSKYLKRRIADAVLRGVAFAPPRQLYLGLMLSPEQEAEGNEYARRPVEFGAPDDEGVYRNMSRINFHVAVPEGWGRVTHTALFDSIEKGNLLVLGPLAQNKLIEAGDIMVFGIGDLACEMKG